MAKLEMLPIGNNRKFLPRISGPNNRSDKIKQ